MKSFKTILLIAALALSIVPTTTAGAEPIEDTVITVNEPVDANGEGRGDFCYDFRYEANGSYTPLPNEECDDTISAGVRAGNTLAIDLGGITSCAELDASRDSECLQLIDDSGKHPLADCRLELEVRWQYYRDGAESTEETNESRALLNCGGNGQYNPDTDTVSGTMWSRISDRGVPVLGRVRQVTCPTSGNGFCLIDSFAGPDYKAIQVATQNVPVVDRGSTIPPTVEVHGAGSVIDFFSEFDVTISPLDVDLTICATGQATDPSSSINDTWAEAACPR